MGRCGCRDEVHAGGGRACEGSDHLFREGMACGEPCDGAFADDFRLFGCAGDADEVGVREFSDGVQSAHGVEAGRWLSGIEEFPEETFAAWVAPFCKEAVRSVSVPTVWVGEGFDECVCVGGCEVDLGSSVGAALVWSDSPESAAVIAAVEIEMSLDFVGDAPGMLDDLAVHVADVETSVGCVGEVHDAHPGVLGGGELAVGFIGGTFAGECDSIAGYGD